MLVLASLDKTLAGLKKNLFEHLKTLRKFARPKYVLIQLKGPFNFHLRMIRWKKGIVSYNNVPYLSRKNANRF